MVEAEGYVCAPSREIIFNFDLLHSKSGSNNFIIVLSISTKYGIFPHTIVTTKERHDQRTYWLMIIRLNRRSKPEEIVYLRILKSKINNNVIIPMKYGNKCNVTRFNSNGGTYYIHIVGASEKENQYTLFVGTPMLSSDEVYVSFDPVKTSGTVKKFFTLADEAVLPRDSIVAKITLRDLTVNYTGARVTSSSSPTSIIFKKSALSGNIGSLNMELKSRWDIEYYPKSTVTSVPIADFFYFYPVYDNTEYPHLPNIRK